MTIVIAMVEIDEIGEDNRHQIVAGDTSQTLVDHPNGCTVEVCNSMLITLEK